MIPQVWKTRCLGHGSLLWRYIKMLLQTLTNTNRFHDLVLNIIPAHEKSCEKQTKGGHPSRSPWWRGLGTRQCCRVDVNRSKCRKRGENHDSCSCFPVIDGHMLVVCACLNKIQILKSQMAGKLNLKIWKHFPSSFAKGWLSESASEANQKQNIQSVRFREFQFPSLF